MGNQPSISSKRKEIARKSGVSFKVVTAMCVDRRRKSVAAEQQPTVRCKKLKHLRQSVQRAIDTNQDGKIEVEEYVRFLLQMSQGTVDDRLKELFQIFDANGDGYISRDEVGRIFAAADEIYEREHDNARAEKFFNTVDLDGDGKLTCVEFVSAAKNDDSIKADLEEIQKIILGRSAEIDSSSLD